MPAFHIEHFGCRAARADGEAIGDGLRARGLSEQQPRHADIVVVNTCSVTAEADRAARAFIRKAHRDNPGAKIVVTGCYAQRAPQELAAMAGVAAVVGNSHKALAPDIAMGLATAPQQLVPVAALLAPDPSSAAPIWADDRFAHSFLEEAQLVPGVQTRPNLKIQEGCGNRCTFCVIPQTRGSSRSLSRQAVLRQVEGFVAAGGKELVLSGINLGRWGRELAFQYLAAEVSWSPTLAPEKQPQVLRLAPLAQDDSKDGAPLLGGGDARKTDLAKLVREIVERTGLPRLRLSSIEPMDWDDELIGLMAEFGGTRIARHAHLPLQSGSDAVLRRMHRRYRPWHYAEKVEKLLAAAGPALTLGADVMVGFPGETDAEFEETIDLVRALPFGYLHLFPFSPRPGTRAWALDAERPVPSTVVDERMAALRALAAEKLRRHRARFVGQQLDAITLHTPATLAAQGRVRALTENFLPVEIGELDMDANQLIRVAITGLSPDAALTAVRAS